MENHQTNIPPTSSSSSSREADHDQLDDFLESLPKEKGWVAPHLYLYQGFWYPPDKFSGLMAAQKHFQAHQTDIILATIPKSGTTWLKALVFAIAHRHHYTLSNHPLLTSNPHELIPFLENSNVLPDISQTPRVFSTHIPCHSLPKSINNSACRVVYLCRNPFDTFISSWNFFKKARSSSLEPLSLDDAFNMYCKGVIGFGPFWDHVLGYWKESLERPHKVLFLKYEDLHEDVIVNMKRLAEFMGVPFSVEEESEGVIEEISRLCSFSNLRDLEVNKTGSFSFFEKKTLFRRGEVGDWVNYFTHEMVERLHKVVEEKLEGSGLSFKRSL